MMRSLIGAIITVIIPLVGLFGFVYGVNENDRLGQSYKQSHTPPKNGYPFASDVEADDLFNTNTAVSFGSEGPSVGQNDSVLVRVARFMMRIAVMLGIPLLIYSGIKLALTFGDKSKAMEAIKHIGYLVGGLLIVLLSVMIVFIITSITRGSLNLFFMDLPG